MANTMNLTQKTCAVCREPEPSGGMRVGVHWAAGGASNVPGLTWQVCQRCMEAGRRAKRGVVEPQPNLSAAVQTLETLAEKWRESRAPNPPAHVSTKCKADNHSWCHNRNPDESHCQCACHYDKGEADKARRQCADELSEALSHLPRQREGIDPKELCDICENPLGDATVMCPHCQTPFARQKGSSE